MHAAAGCTRDLPMSGGGTCMPQVQRIGWHPVSNVVIMKMDYSYNLDSRWSLRNGRQCGIVGARVCERRASLEDFCAQKSRLRHHLPPQLPLNVSFKSGYSLHKFTNGRNICFLTGLPSFSAFACSPAHAHICDHGIHSHFAHLCGSIACSTSVKGFWTYL